MKVDPAKAPTSGEDGLSTLHLSVAGGVTQFGAYIDRLAPGAWSSFRHWHSAEDEFLYVLEGIVTVRDEDGMRDLGPCDAACWRHGDPNGHHVTNRGDLPCRYVIVGSRVAQDVCTYPDDGRRQINGATRWQIVATDGTVLRQGDLPAELLNLPPVWGNPYDPAHPLPRILRAADAVWTRDENPVHPIIGPGPGPYASRLISDVGGLSQFGAFVEELPPAAAPATVTGMRPRTRWFTCCPVMSCWWRIPKPCCMRATPLAGLRGIPSDTGWTTGPTRLRAIW